MSDTKNRTISSAARRQFVRRAGALAAGLTAMPVAGLAAAAAKEDLAFADGPRELIAYPQKRPLIRVTTRPPHLETPFEIFDGDAITPNDAFFVRYHLADIPLSIDPETYRLTVRGAVAKPLSLSLQELQRMGQHEVVAVNLCSGNGRGFFAPRVFGAQLGHGAMGNARWGGVPLKTVLEKAGVGAGARQVVFNGLDRPVLPTTSDFRKTLDVEHALSAEVLLAWSMNGQDIPFLNGYPLKLIVPGYFGTYWVKHLADIEVIDRSYEGHDALFMSKIYRMPDNEDLCVAPGAASGKTRPISVLPVRSLITSVANGGVLPAGRMLELKGIAFDGGSGIRTVEVSIDGGRSWRAAELGRDLGRYSFRQWRLPVSFARKGSAVLMVRAGNRQGEVQPDAAAWNPSGYRRRVIESTSVTIV
jgi:sulfite dehydrogenase